MEYSKSLWSYNPIPDRCRLYLPIFSSSLSAGVFSSVDPFGYSCVNTTSVWDGISRNMDGNDYLSIGGLADFSFLQNTGIFTLCGWMKMTDNTADRSQCLLGTVAASAEKGFGFIYDNRSSIPSNNRFRLDLMKGTGGVVGITSDGSDDIITDNNWHFCVATGDATNVFFRVDRGNKAQGSSSIVGLSSGDSTRVLRAGCSNAAVPTHFLVGSQGEIWIYDYNLTDTELDYIYDKTEWRY